MRSATPACLPLYQVKVMLRERQGVAPHLNVISIVPLRRARGGSSPLDLDTISTGKRDTLSSDAGAGAISRRHLKTWLAFTSWRCATIETDEPGSSVFAQSGASPPRTNADA